MVYIDLDSKPCIIKLSSIIEEDITLLLTCFVVVGITAGSLLLKEMENHNKYQNKRKKK